MTVRINRRAIRELATGDEFRRHLEDVADEIIDRTAANARDRHYGPSLETEIRNQGGELVARVGTDNEFAHLDEWGSENNEPSGAMRRAIESLGLDVELL